MDFLTIRKTGGLIGLWNFIGSICEWRRTPHVYFVAHLLKERTAEVDGGQRRRPHTQPVSEHREEVRKF